MLRYRDEIKDQILSNIEKIALRVILPVYILFNIFDWMTTPQHAVLFLFIRLSMLPCLVLALRAAKTLRFKKWYFVTVWLAAAIPSTQLTFMAYHSGEDVEQLYLHSINIVAGLILFVFPLRGIENIVTLLCVYAAPLSYVWWRMQTSNSALGFSSLMLLFTGFMTLFLLGALAMDRVRYQTFLQKTNLYFLAITDALTGLKLRRYFLKRFVQELSLASRRGRNIVISLVMLDVDNFKGINDRYGHEAGDKCLKHVAAVLLKNIRIYDIACRFGGDEILLLFPELDPATCRLVCEKLRRAVENEPFMVKEERFPLTVSIGAYSANIPFPDFSKDPDLLRKQNLLVVKNAREMIRKADEALYMAKQAGKNRTEIRQGDRWIREISEKETPELKGFLAELDEKNLELQPEPGRIRALDVGEEINLFSAEYFFRRCVEGLYRNYRNSQWLELMTLIRIDRSAHSDMKKVLCQMFRLFDVISEIEPGVFGVLFVGLPADSLDLIRDRIWAEVSKTRGGEDPSVKIAAAALRFSGKTDYSRFKKKAARDAFFSEEISLLYERLAAHHFDAGEEIYFYKPAEKL